MCDVLRCSAAATTTFTLPEPSAFEVAVCERHREQVCSGVPFEYRFDDGVTGRPVVLMGTDLPERANVWGINDGGVDASGKRVERLLLATTDATGETREYEFVVPKEAWQRLANLLRNLGHLPD